MAAKNTYLCRLDSASVTFYSSVLFTVLNVGCGGYDVIVYRLLFRAVSATFCIFQNKNQFTDKKDTGIFSIVGSCKCYA